MFESPASAAVSPARLARRPPELRLAAPRRTSAEASPPTGRRSVPGLRTPPRVAGPGGRAVVSLLALAALAAGHLQAADGNLDTTFRSGGKFVYQTFLGPSTPPIAFRSDGVPLVGYTVNLSGTDRDMRVLPVPDNGFTTHCVSYHPDLGGTDDDRIRDIVVLGNLLYVAGDAAGPTGDPTRRLAIATYNLTTCQLDPTFGGSNGLIFDFNPGAEHELTSIVLNGNGSVRVAAQLDPPGSLQERLVRFGLESNGTLDPGFTSGAEDFASVFGAVKFRPGGMVRQPDGKLLVVGTMTLANGDQDVGVARYLANGNLDTSFSGDGLAGFSYDIADAGFDHGHAIGVLPDRRIVVTGAVQRSGGAQAAIAVLTPSGNYDNSFGTFGRYSFTLWGSSPWSSARSLAIQGDGKIIVAGETGPGGAFADNDFGIARLLPTGSSPLDPEFGVGGKRRVFFDLGGWDADGASDVQLDPQGRIFVAGYAQTDTNDWALAMARLTNSYIFADSYEWGSTQAWSSAGP